MEEKYKELLERGEADSVVWSLACDVFDELPAGVFDRDINPQDATRKIQEVLTAAIHRGAAMDLAQVQLYITGDETSDVKQPHLPLPGKRDTRRLSREEWYIAINAAKEGKRGFTDDVEALVLAMQESTEPWCRCKAEDFARRGGK